MRYTSRLPAYSPLNAIHFPSGEKWGFNVCPWKLVKRRALPPERGTVQMLLAYANAICDELTVGVRSNRLCPFTTEAATQQSRQMSDRITDRRQGSAANMNLRRIELSSRKM